MEQNFNPGLALIGLSGTGPRVKIALQALLTCFVLRDILCKGPKFEIILKFSMENTLNSGKKKENTVLSRQNITFYFSDVYN